MINCYGKTEKEDGIGESVVMLSSIVFMLSLSLLLISTVLLLLLHDDDVEHHDTPRTIVTCAKAKLFSPHVFLGKRRRRRRRRRHQIYDRRPPAQIKRYLFNRGISPRLPCWISDGDTITTPDMRCQNPSLSLPSLAETG